MHLRFHFIVWSLLPWSPTWTLTDKDWDQILPDLTNLCPNVDFCGKTQTATRTHKNEENICCRGCSCADNCSKSRDCCDGTGDNDIISDCLVPSTNQDKKLNTYHFVVEPPVDGCKQSLGQGLNENMTCSPDEIVAPWGNFLPVYSKSLDKNFKNEQCARCHGAEDVERWTSILYIDYAPYFVGTLAEFLEANNMNDCFVVFKPPNSDSSTFEKLCFKETGSCPRSVSDSFYVTSNVQMKRDSIIHACEEGPSAKYLGPHGRAFKNVFCAICNGYARRFNDQLRCENTIDADKELSPPIRVLLDSTYITSTTSKTMSALSKKEKGVCYRHELSKNESICEGLYCPSMQILLPNGKCGYVAKFVRVENLVLCLNLSTDYGPDNIDAKKMSDTHIHSLFEEQSPWSQNWFIYLVALLISPKPDWLEFLICLKFKAKQTNMEILSQEIKSTLTEKWRVNLDPQVVFNQALTKHGRTDFGYAGINITAEWTLYVSDFVIDLVPPTWKSMYAQNFHLSSPLVYNQMFFCEQIQLQPDEYEHSSPGAVLYLPNRHDFLYPNQFTSLVDVDGSFRVRVCLKDSGYVRMVSRAGTNQWMTFNVFLVIVKFIGKFADTA